MSWEIRSNASRELYGPLDQSQVIEHLANGNFVAEDWGRTDDDEPWRQLGEFAEFELYTHEAPRRRPPSDDDDAMDMTPMIDVTFLLLIFFMVTATFHLQKGLDFPPAESQDEEGPKQAGAGLAKFADRIIVTIDQNDRFSLKESSPPANAGDNHIDADQLANVLSDVSQKRKRSRVLILAHDLASHEAVVKAIDSAAKAGIRDVAVGDVKAPKAQMPRATGTP
jgi:biopolymer transport protein ExbD